MIYFIAVLDATQDGNGILHGRLIYHYRLKPTLQGLILFDIFPIFIHGGGTDAVQLTSRQHGFQHISGIQRALGLAGAHNGVQLVDKENDLPIGLLHGIQHCLQTFLKFTSVLGTGNEGTHIQGEDLLILQRIRHIALYDPLSQTLNCRRLADTRITDQHRIILGLPGQDPDDVTDLCVPANDRIQLLIPCPLYQTGTVLFQCIITVLRTVGLYRPAVTQILYHVQEFRLFDPIFLKQILHCRAAMPQQSQKEMFYGDILISHLLRFILSIRECLPEIRADILLLRCAVYPRKRVHKPLCLPGKLIHIDPLLRQDLHDQTVLDGEQRQQQMLRLQFQLSVLIRQLLRQLNGFNGFLRIIIKSHNTTSYLHTSRLKRSVKSSRRTYIPLTHFSLSSESVLRFFVSTLHW